MDHAHSARASGERRLVTVLFLDLSGFSGLCERRDPEQVTGILNALFAEVVEVVDRYDGYLDKFIGDAAMAVFGAPRAHEDDAERAARVAWEVMQRLPALSARLGEDAPLRLHAGLASGQVISGVVGAGDAARYTVLGDAVNVASRLLDHAKAGEILLSGSSAGLLRGRLTLAARGDVGVRGRLAPVPVFSLEGLTNDDRRPSARSAFVGRDAELSRLKVALAAAAQGSGGSLQVCGPAGVGKSRLVAEALGDGAEGLRVHRQRALSYATPTPYLPWRETLRGLLEELGFAEAERVEALLRGEGEGGAAWRDAALDVTCALWREACARAPRVLLFEDMQWSDRASLDLFDALAAVAADHPLLLLGLSRAPRVDASPRAPLSLGPLSPGECRELIDHLWRGPSLSPALRRSLVKRSGGVPLYIEELVRSAQLSGQGRGQGREQPLSVTLQALLAEGLDRLAPEALERLEVAAVVGPSFSPALVDALVGGDAPALWASLVADGVLEEGSGGALRYRQVLTQEALYDRMLKARRAALHGAVADALEGEDTRTQRALHLQLAGRIEEAAPLWLAAARRARVVHALDDALTHLNAALESPAHRAEALRERATLHQWQGRVAEAAADLEGALRLETGGAERVELLRERAFVGYLEGDGVALMRWAERAVEEAQEHGDEALLAGAWRGLGIGHEFLGRYAEAVDAYRRAVLASASMPEGPRRDLQGRTFNSLGEIARALGRYEDALSWYERSVVVRGGVTGGPALIYRANSGAALLGLGRFTEALGRLNDCVAEARRTGWRAALAEVLAVRSEVRRCLGDRAGACRDLDEAEALAREQEQAEWLAYTARVRGALHLEDGALVEAEAQARQSLGVFEDIGKVSGQVAALQLLSRVLAARGQTAASGEATREASERAAGLVEGMGTLNPGAWVQEGDDGLFIGVTENDGGAGRASDRL